MYKQQVHQYVSDSLLHFVPRDVKIQYVQPLRAPFCGSSRFYSCFQFISPIISSWFQDYSFLKAQCQSVLHKQAVQPYTAVMPASHSPCLCTTPSWAHLCVCRDDWVSFNRPDHENTCWTSQGRCITCWKGVLGFSSVHKYTDVWHVCLHIHIHIHTSKVLRSFPLLSLSFSFIWIAVELIFLYSLINIFFQLAANLLMAVGTAFDTWQQRVCHCLSD